MAGIFIFALSLRVAIGAGWSCVFVSGLMNDRELAMMFFASL
jgi:hypothetical protein